LVDNRRFEARMRRYLSRTPSKLPENFMNLCTVTSKANSFYSFSHLGPISCMYDSNMHPYNPIDPSLSPLGFLSW